MEAARFVIAEMVNFILKILLLSAVISVGIKYGGPYLGLAGTTTTALVAVLSPTILMAILLSWRWQKYTEVKP